MTLTIDRRERGQGALCALILADLPDWFGMPASNADYAALAESGPSWIAIRDGVPVGILILKSHGSAVEIYLLAVLRAQHDRGVGRRLVEAAEAEAQNAAATFLTVKTRGPSAPDPHYERTRGFYERVGFTALEEFTEIWGPENPTLFMVRPVG